MMSPDEIKDLPGIIEALLDERARSIIKVNCARIALPNGAQTAADLIVRLAGAVENEQVPPPAKAMRPKRETRPRKLTKKHKRIKERA